MTKKRTINEYRQVKDNEYTPPVSHETKINSQNSVNELSGISTILKEAYSNGLAIEVIYFALKAMKSNPSLTVVEAMICGCDEWDV